MKYRYIGSIELVMVVNDKLTSVKHGEIVELATPQGTDFEALEIKKPQSIKTKVALNKIPKKTNPEEVTNASQTKTSKLG